MEFIKMLCYFTLSMTTGHAAMASDPDILGLVPEIGYGLMAGYLHGEPTLNSAEFVPSPPKENSARQLADSAASEALCGLKGSAPWDLAAKDADLHFPGAASLFSCALGATISTEQTPALYRLLQRSLTDLVLATYPAKKAHQRPRPFLLSAESVCTPEKLELLKTDGSYPSGQSSIGWGWALTPSQLAPDRAEALLARGRDYATSRMVCNVHWMSDTEAGMALGAAAFARLQNNALFKATMSAARAELASWQATPPNAERCEQEASVLALSR